MHNSLNMFKKFSAGIFQVLRIDKKQSEEKGGII
jgi:hypothetical protein